jgi:septin 7/cell division control protein 12
MKLSNMVNVIPILARGDQYTKKEVLELKKQYDKMFSQYHVDIYDCLNINDEQFKTELKEG